MNTRIFHEEIATLRRRIIIDTAETEPGNYETMALNDLGDTLDAATSSSWEEAERDFRAMLQRHAGPLQAAFCRAGLVPGERYTLVCLSDLGFPVAQRMTYYEAALRSYAQYDDAVQITYQPYRKRNMYVMNLYNRSFLIYAGWRELDRSATFRSMDGGAAFASKYASFDEHYLSDIKAAWPDYIAAYDREMACRRDDEAAADGAQQTRSSEARAPYALLPGLTVIFDAEGCNGPCVDIEIDEFARIYGQQDDDDMAERLTRALKRAAITSALHICDDDGGTCNFDSPALDYAACSMSKADAEAAIKAVGLHCHDWKPFRNHRGDDGKLVVAPTYLVISGFQSGQGLRRTRMAEAFCQQLNEDGFEAGMYYRMD